MATTRPNSRLKLGLSKDITPVNENKAKEYGLLVDYEWCTGCHSCEVACQMENHLEAGKYGITVFEFGPQLDAEGKWEWTFLPMPTSYCDLCAERTEMGKLPTCVHHCQSNVMYWGPLTELAEKLAEKPTQVLFSL